MHLKALDECIENAHRLIENARRTDELYGEVAAEAIAEFFHRGEGDDRQEGQAWADMSDGKINLTIIVDRLSEVSSVLEFFIDRDLRIFYAPDYSRSTATTRNYWLAWRRFKDDPSAPNNWDHHIYLTITPRSCKRVQIGTETKEVPIYEVVCE